MREPIGRQRRVIIGGGSRHGGAYQQGRNIAAVEARNGFRGWKHRQPAGCHFARGESRSPLSPGPTPPKTSLHPAPIQRWLGGRPRTTLAVPFRVKLPPQHPLHYHSPTSRMDAPVPTPTTPARSHRPWCPRCARDLTRRLPRRTLTVRLPTAVRRRGSPSQRSRGGAGEEELSSEAGQ